MPLPADVPHPGKRIKAEVIPNGMSVTKAAQLMGVGRPALSNLLNGNASLSADMATRLEKTFNCPRRDLMEMQARYEVALAEQKTPAVTKTYVPPFLAIKANDVERWVSHNIAARSRLAVLLRTLVHSTGSGLTKVVFPGNDDAERPGWDGFVEATAGTPWVPAGRSGWEFGTNEDPKQKADSDFKKSVKAHEKRQRADIAFLFVTPRRWPGKATWVAAAQAKRLWKEVRAYDASDLEEWLEQSLAAQAWFANETYSPAQHVRSLDKCWADWTNVSHPPLSGALFSSAIEATKRTMLARLGKSPEGPILIAADSTEEALAFLAQLLGDAGGEEFAPYRDRVLVFDKPGVLPRLVAGAQNIIPVAFTRDVERELAPYANSMHSIVVYPRNAASVKPAIVLEPVHYETFNKALEAMGKKRDEIVHLGHASGRSLTVLRRQLSKIPAVRTPEWADDHKTAASLVPFLFVEAWSSENEADKLGLSLLTGGCSYGELEKQCQSLSQLNDTPVWSVGKYRGVISKIDLLYAIAGAVTPEDLHRYFSMARMVLGEDDPALDLDEDQRWAAAIHGKRREFSSAFRGGISETLVLLSIHGGNLFRDRLGVDTEIEAAAVVRELLPMPLTTRIFEANRRDLPTYAEAAPDEFLTILERDLNSEDPAALGLLRPVDPSMFGNSPSRTGLLWALEGLSWNPTTLPRAARILARLAQIEINDNWVNKPMNSLKSIFRAWMPQTAASHQQRVDMIKKLAASVPDVAWKVCIAQIGIHHDVGDYSHKPRWRPDGYGFGEPFPTWEPIIGFMNEMVEMALNWGDHSVEMLCDLVERLQDLADTDQARVWALIEAWAKNNATDANKAALRERIRVSIFSRRAAARAKGTGGQPALAAAGKAASDALEPTDILNKHAWLFKDGWVEESADDVDDIEKLDFRERDERVKKLRIGALREIIAQRGSAGILDLSKRGNASWVIGVLTASDVLSVDESIDLLRLARVPIVSDRADVQPYKNLISGAFHSLLEEKKREAIVKGVTSGLSEIDMVKLFTLAPFHNNTWKLVDALGDAAKSMYWNDVIPSRNHDSNLENTDGVERLLKAGRPRAAFSCIRLYEDEVDAQLLFRLLSAMAEGGNDLPGHFMLEQYNVGEAFKKLNRSPELTLDQKAGLEFAYIDVLSRPWAYQDNYGIPNLERYVEAHPELFVQAIAWTYKRTDGGTDPAELHVPLDRVEAMAERGYKLLKAIQRVPGHNDLSYLETERLAK